VLPRPLQRGNTQKLEGAVNATREVTLIDELDRVKEQLVYLRFWLGIMVATEIPLVGWLISTAVGANATLWLWAHLGRSR